MNIRVIRKSYTTLSNYPIVDINLSAISLGIFCYIMSKPDGWKAHKNEIYKRFSNASISTSKNAIDQAFKELVSSGYVEIKAIMTTNDKGQKMFNGKEYVFNEEPNTIRQNLPKSEDFGSSEISEIGNFRSSEILPYIVNTDLIVNTNNKVNTDLIVNIDSISEIENVKYFFELNQIIELLTEKTKAKYKIPKSKSVLLRYGVYKLIKERFEDGATLEDFFKVIDYKYNEWNNTTFMKYLTPETLFRKSNFDKYLTQIQIQPNLNTQKPVKDANGNYSDTKEGRELFITNIRERAIKLLSEKRANENYNSGL